MKRLSRCSGYALGVRAVDVAVGRFAPTWLGERMVQATNIRGEGER